MELPQPRPYGTEGSKSTHDFLSLYTHSTSQQDPLPSSSQGAYLQTHDFLQPLERIEKTCLKEETNIEVSTAEEPPPAAPPPVERLILPGGIGTYSISHISYFSQTAPKPEGSMFTMAQSSSTERNDENSNCSSLPGSGFTLWEESALNKGKTGKENVGERPSPREPPAKIGQWTNSSERPSQSSSTNRRNGFSSLSSSQPIGQKSQSFMDMINSAKGSSHEEELDDDEDFFVKKETSTVTKGDLRIRVEGKISDQKANTPRSKHSATEQRRRSKINDRFQKLREIIPHGDQKRDKASFLLEVVEYIKCLQEKVHKFEGSCQGWSHQPAKSVPWSNNHQTVDQSRGANNGTSPALVFPEKFDEKNVPITPVVPGGSQNQVDSDMRTATTFKAVAQYPETTNKAMPFPVSLQPNLFTAVNGGVISQLPPRLTSDEDKISLQTQISKGLARCYATDVAIAHEKLKEKELTIDGGTISISSVYSQGLLNSLTRALQSSGVDLSQASISVQIELGKRASDRAVSPASIVQEVDTSLSNLGSTRSRVAAAGDSERSLKKLKTGRS